MEANNSTLRQKKNELPMQAMFPCTDPYTSDTIIQYLQKGGCAMSDKLYHGVSWYPELWGEDIWREDIATMQALKINLVRMGDFIWSTVEPERGNYDFSLLQRAADRLYEAGIDFVLTTGTAVPPIWLTDGHPERCHRDARGVMSHGSRQHACINNQEIRAVAVHMVEQYASALGGHPGLVLWQIDNEMKSHVGNCLCGTCKQKWHDWLAKRYGSIGALNEAWTTGIFSQHYQSFAQVPVPLLTPFQHNPSLLTAYHRFTMDSAADYAAMQADAIRRHSSAPVTTNGNIGFHLNHSSLFQRLDIAAFTTYASQENHAIYLMNHDYWRNIKPGRKHWLLETTCLHTGHLENIAVPLPKGYLAAEAAAAYALDSQSICYWHMRQHRNGCEIGHSAILSAWGKKTAGWEEVEKAAQIKKMMEPLILRTRHVKPSIALFYSDIARAYYETEKLKNGSYSGWIRHFHKLLFKSGYPRDVITETNDWDGYRLVWTPFLPHMDEATLEKAEQFVCGGGTWICGPMTGYRTAEHGVPADAALGEAEKRFGFSVKYIAPLFDTSADVDGFEGKPGLSLWGFAFDEQDIKPFGRFCGGCMDGEICFAEKPVGKGTLVLLGALPVGEDGDALLTWIAQRYINKSGITRSAVPSEGVELVERENGCGKAIVAINMDTISGTVLYNGKSITLKPFETRIITDATGEQ